MVKVNPTNIFLLCLLNFFSINSYSVEEFHKSSCRLLSYKSDGSLHAICSGTLITPGNLVRTAAHCVDWLNEMNGKITVECGQQGLEQNMEYKKTSYGSTVPVKGVKFEEIREAKKVYIHSGYSANSNEVSADQAIITLNQTIETITSSEEGDRDFLLSLIDKEETCYNSLTDNEFATCLKFRSGVECNVSGYGFQPSGEIGVLSTSIIDLKKGSFFLSNNSVQWNTSESTSIELVSKVNQCRSQDTDSSLSELLKIFIDHDFKVLLTGGYSGGGLFCRKDSKSQWKLLGTTTQSGMFGAEVFGTQKGFLKTSMIWDLNQDKDKNFKVLKNL